MPVAPPAAGKAKIRVFVADDHPFLRVGLTHLINKEADLTVCGEAETVAAVRSGVEKEKPDVFLTDLCLGDGDGLELIKSLKAQFPELPILVLSQQDETLFAERALRAGARGYIMKERATQDVLEGIRTIVAGDLYVSRKVAALAMRKLVEGGTDATAPAGSEISGLSDRELQVFRLLGAGKKTMEIAEALKLSHKTIETYRENIKHKLNLPNATALIHRATEWLQSQAKPGK
ncbi:MAG: DNA-binding response regulator [Verrucomicrobia bacterium]|nr:DNA-binding response regulator [Verrucomicrobiota bacterium]NDB78186.1 DNA-binding response regulator [Verrucomicrobiota bacterium]